MPRPGWDILQSWLRFLTRWRVTPLRGLAVAAGCAAVAAGLRFVFEPLIGTSVPFISFFPALMISSLAAGAWPGFLVLIAGSLLAALYWLPPSWSYMSGLGQVPAILAFWVIGAFLILMGTVLRALVRELTDARDHADLLAHEMKHRAGNLLGVIQAIARQTARSATDIGDYQERFEARLLALSRAQDFASGLPGNAPNLETFLSAALEPFGRDRFALAGPPAALPPGLASAFALLLHELGTNAMKYGALSVSDGRCAVAWVVANGRVQLEWRETGGPPVAPPGRSGFGSKLLKLAFPPETGHAAITYDPAGVRCEISFPAAR